LSLQAFAGAPNYESVAGGDAEELYYVVRLPRNMCLEDGNQFADPAHAFDSVQLYTTSPTVRARLRADVGRQVRVFGTGFAAQSGHHHEPLVVNVSEVRLASREP
jgi:hypothetical protein